MKTRRALTTIFAISGASGLIYEVAWMRTLRLLVGSTTLSHTIVLAAFMTGLALGAWIAGKKIDAQPRPLRVYAWLEAAIGLYGLVFPLLAHLIVPPLGALYRAFEESPGLFAVGELLLLGPILFPGAALMGATLPALGRVVAEHDVAREGGWLYAVNTLGAAVGAAIAGFFLLPFLGLLTTLFVAAATNGVLSALAFKIERAQPPVAASPKSDQTEEKGWPRLAALAVTVSALGGMTLQIVWTKLFVVSVGSSTFAFTGVVAVYILGIGAGAALAVRLLATNAEPSRLLALASTLAALAAAATAPFFLELPHAVAYIITHWTIDMRVVLLLETVLVAIGLGPAALLLGTVFPLGVAVAGGSPAQSGRALARISVASSIGSILGALVGGLILVRVLGLTGALRAGAILAGSAGIVALLASRGGRALLAPVTGVMVAAALLAPGPNARLLDAGAFLYGRDRMEDSLLQQGAKKRLITRAARLLYHAEGEDLISAIYTTGVDDVLVTNGKIDASSHFDAETQRLVAHIPMLLHRGPIKNVAIIGLGSGMTAGAALSHPGVERLDVVEISRTVVDVVQHSDIFVRLSHDALHDKRLRLLIADGRTHLRHASEQYDVIISEPTNPWIAGVGDLYTTENFQHVKERLAPGGIFAQWLQGYGTTSPLYRTIVRTFHDIFPDVQIWRFAEGEDSLLIARKEGGDLPLRFTDVSEIVGSSPLLKASLEDAGVDEAHSIAWYFALDPKGTAELAGEGPRNTDDSGYLEHRAPLALFNVAHPLDEDVAVDLQREARPPFPDLTEEERTKIHDALPYYHRAVIFKALVNDPRILPEAEKQIRKAIAIVPGAQFLRSQLASILAYEIGRGQILDDERVKKLLLEIEDTRPRSTVVLGIEAATAGRLGLKALAESCYRKLVELRPEAVDPRLHLAELLIGRREYAAGLSVLAQAKEESADVLTVRASALYGLGRPQEGKPLLDQALALDPGLTRAWLLLGFVRTQEGDMAAARAAFEKVTELTPNDPDRWCDLAGACLRAGDRAGAERACRKALDVKPGFERAQKLLEQQGP
jgi:spermidine synthase